jgi:imidazole glycerol-phosphate synthase subunit HisH
MSQPFIVIVDYGAGNLRSVQRKFERVGANVHVTADLNTIMSADKLVLPGVGHFANGVRKLKESGIWDVLNTKVLVKKTPIFGICLGMQLMAKSSEEGNAEGLGWFDAEVVRFKVSDRLAHKVPHMGWNDVSVQKDSLLFDQVPPQAMFYFVHSYVVRCNRDSDALAMTTYDYPFASAIERDNIFGTQFHPEKSHDWGEQLIRNFTEKV